MRKSPCRFSCISRKIIFTSIEQWFSSGDIQYEYFSRQNRSRSIEDPYTKQILSKIKYLCNGTDSILSKYQQSQTFQSIRISSSTDCLQSFCLRILYSHSSLETNLCMYDYHCIESTLFDHSIERRCN